MPVKKIDEERSRVVLEDFTGAYNLILDPSKINENEFTLFENLIVYQRGRFMNATKRRGFTVYNTNANIDTYTTIQSIYEYISKKGNFTRLIAKTFNTSDGAFEYAVGTGTWTLIAEDVAISKVRFLTFRDILYIFDRRSPAALVNKSYDGTSFLDMGLPPAYHNFRTLAVTVTALPSVVSNSTFFYFITFVYDNNQESWGISPNDSSVYPDRDSSQDGGINYPNLSTQFVQGTTGAGQVMKLYDLPIGNARVTARKIYRSKNGGGQLYYHSTIYNNTDDTFFDNKPDTELVEEADLEYVFRPLSARFGVQHKNRIFIGNLKENQYGADVDETAVVGTTSTGGGIQVSGDSRAWTFKYKFAFLYFNHSFSVTAGVPSGFNGFVGAYSDPLTVSATDPTHNRNTLTNIGNVAGVNAYAGRVIIKRTACQFVLDITQDGASMRIELIASGVAFAFQEGETINLSDVTSTFANDPSGNHVVTSINVGSRYVFVTFNLGAGAYTSGGVVQGTNYHYLGTTPIIGSTNAQRFIDDIPDNDMVLGGNYLNNKNFEELTENKGLPSTVQWSEVNQGDKYPGLNSIEVEPNDNDEITGIFSEADGLRIFKNRNIYKLYTTSVSQDDWRLRRVVENVGASDPYSIVQINEDEYIFIMNNVFYHLKGESVVRCSDKIQTDLDGLTFTNIDSTYDPYKNWVVFTYSVSGTTGNVLIYDLNTRDESGFGIWYHFKKNSTNNLGLQCPLVTQAGLLLFANSLKRIYQYSTSSNQDEVGASFAGVNILIKLQTKLWETEEVNIKRVCANIFTSGAGASNGLSIVASNGVVAEDISFTDTLTSGIYRPNKSLNLFGKAMQVRFENQDNVNLTFKGIAIDFNPRHQEKGWYN